MTDTASSPGGDAQVGIVKWNKKQRLNRKVQPLLFYAVAGFFDTRSRSRSRSRSRFRFRFRPHPRSRFCSRPCLSTPCARHGHRCFRGWEGLRTGGSRCLWAMASFRIFRKGGLLPRCIVAFPDFRCGLLPNIGRRRLPEAFPGYPYFRQLHFPQLFRSAGFHALGRGG